MEGASDRTDLGIGQTVIRGLDTDRLMVRRELCHLIAWITAVSCADIVSTQIAQTLKCTEAPSRCSQHRIPEAVPPFPHTRSCRRPSVKGVSRPAVRSTLDRRRTAWHRLCSRFDMIRHHTPDEAGELSGDGSGRDIVFLTGENHFVELPSQAFIGPICIVDDSR